MKFDVIADGLGFPEGPIAMADGSVLFVEVARARTYKGGSIERVELPTGRVERLYEYCGEHRLSSPNDIVFDRNGGMWFTDMGRPTGRYRMMSGVYYASPDGESISEQFSGVSFNGIGLSPDERTLYVSDTFPARIWSFELEAPGRIKAAAAPCSPIRYLATMPGHMEVDSMALTQSGKLCVATFGIGGIAIVSPDGEIEHRPLP